MSQMLRRLEFAFLISRRGAMGPDLMRQVGDEGAGNGMDEEGPGDEEEGAGEEEGEDVEDMAKTTFEGHSDAVYCVAVNPKVPSQVGH